MYSSELEDLVECAEHLLWVIARHDVENLSGQRQSVLRRLQEVEARAVELGVCDLYKSILQHCALSA